MKSKGLGDTIAKITEATGIDKLVKFIAGEDCGCDERKEKLNKLFPYAKPLCLTEDEFNTLDTYFKQNTNTLTSDEQTSLIAINNRVLNQKLTFSTCSSCLRDLVSKLRVIYNEYTPEQTEEVTTEENAVD
jgi:ABC-type thiamine transport system ATPase subunit